MNKNKHLGIRIDETMHYKLSYIAKYEGRSINKEVLFLITECIRNFESKHGAIPFTNEASQ